MRMRTRKKILGHIDHPRHKAAVKAVVRAFEQHGAAECRRMGLDPSRWASYALRLPHRVKYWLRFVPVSTWSRS